ncbi:type VII secretion protein EccB [Streptomyces stramineus]
MADRRRCRAQPPAPVRLQRRRPPATRHQGLAGHLPGRRAHRLPPAPRRDRRGRGRPHPAAKANRVGTVLKAPTGNGTQDYVVLKGKVQRVSPLVAKLLLNSKELTPSARRARRSGSARPTSRRPTRSSTGSTAGPRTSPGRPISSRRRTSRTRASTTPCAASSAACRPTAPPNWPPGGTEYPAAIPDGATSAYVTPGSGILYRQVTGRQTNSGSVFLVTDTGLRYAVQSNNDSGAGKSKIGEKAPPSPGAAGSSDAQGGTGSAGPTEADQARIRLGYQKVDPLPVPANWSQFLPTGPRLDTNSAKQPQGS